MPTCFGSGLQTVQGNGHFGREKEVVCEDCDGSGFAQEVTCAACRFVRNNPNSSTSLPHTCDPETSPAYDSEGTPRRDTERAPPMMLAGGKPEEPGPDDDWWRDRIKLGELLIWLIDEGEIDEKDRSALAYYFEKPWKWDREWERMRREAA